MRRRYTIAAIDDHPLVLDALRDWLEGIGHRLVVCASTGVEFLAQMRLADPVDLAIVDLSMKGMSGFEVLRHLSTEFPGTKAIVLSSYSEPGIVKAAIDAGACSFVSKSTGAPELRYVLDEVVRSGYCQTALMQEGRAAAEREQRAKAMGVPKRELEFLGHLVDVRDLTYDQIAQSMLVTRYAVDGYARWFSTHFGLHSRAAIVLWALENELVLPKSATALLTDRIRRTEADLLH